MDDSRSSRLNEAVKNSTINDKVDKEKLLNMLRDDDFDDIYYPNDTQSRVNDYINPECILIVINLPKVEETRLSKLENFIFKKTVDQPLNKPLAVDFPIDPETTLSKGIMFIHVNDPNDAYLYKEKLNDFRLDKIHRLKVFTYKEYTLTCNMSEEFQFNSYDKPNISASEFNHWLLDNCKSEQFIIVPTYNKKVEKIILNKVETFFDEYQPIDINLNVPAKQVYWSPCGTYLALTSDGGVCIGIITRDNNFYLTCAVRTPDVSHIVFSPNEKYLVLCLEKSQRDNVIVVDTACGGVLWRGSVNFTQSTTSTTPPTLDLYWTHDCKYMIIGKLLSYKILCVEDDFKPHPNSPLNNPFLKLVKVFPQSNCIAYWTTTNDNQNGIAWIYNIDSNSTHKVKQVVSPNSWEFFFQDQSKYLCISYERIIRKKSIYNVDIVFLKEKDLPILSLELTNPVLDLYWEPNGDCFIISHKETFLIYQIIDNQIKLITSYKSQIGCEALWSPNGRIVVIHSAHSQYDPKDMRIIDAYDDTQLNVCQFKNVDKIKWDSSGRFFATCTTSNTFPDSCYTIWTMTGNFIRSQSVDNMSDFLWRPRPPCMLSDSEVKVIVKNLKKYSIDFDKSERDKAKKFHMEKRQELVAKMVNFYNIIFKRIDYIDSYNKYINSCC